MNEPLKIMNEIYRYCQTDGNEWTLDSEYMQYLRTAIEAQAEELAQKDARIARLDKNGKAVIQAVENIDGDFEGIYGLTETINTCDALEKVLNESSRQSAAHLKAEVLRSCVPAMQSEFDANHLLIMANRIEREAKEES